MSKKYKVGDRILIYGQYEFIITRVYYNYLEGIYSYNGMYDRFYFEEIEKCMEL